MSQNPLDRLKKLFGIKSKEFTEAKQITISKDIKGYIKENNLFLKNLSVNFDFDNDKPAIYMFSNKRINIPVDFNLLEENQKILNEAINVFGKDNALKSIISHELGHAVQHDSLNLNYDNCFLIQPYGDNRLLRFLKPSQDRDIAINEFIHLSFAESYADCYSNLILYLKDDNKDCFKKSCKFRFDSKNDIKSKNFSEKDLDKVGEVAVVGGTFAITEYFNYKAIENFESNFINVFSKEKITKFSFKIIHGIIENESIQELYNTIVSELDSNDLFLNNFNDFCKNKGLTIQSYLDEFKQNLNHFRNIQIKNIILEDDYFKKKSEFELLADMKSLITKENYDILESEIIHDSDLKNKKEYLISEIFSDNFFNNNNQTNSQSVKMNYLSTVLSDDTNKYLNKQLNMNKLIFKIKPIKTKQEIKTDFLNSLNIPKDRYNEYRNLDLFLLKVWSKNKFKASFNNSNEETCCLKAQDCVFNICNLKRARGQESNKVNTNSFKCG